MKDGILQLLKLQNVDKELQSLEEAKDKYPAEIGERRGAVDQAQAALTVQEEGLEELQKTQRQHERDLETARISLKEHEERFAEVTNNKEYDALQMEIEACRSKISEFETQILQNIEGADSLQEKLQAERQEFEQVQQEHQGHIDELEQRLASLQEAVDGVLAQRKKVANGLEDRLLKVYERSRKKRGMRVAALRKGACGGCFRQLPAQHRSNVRRGDDIHYCESCGAIMVWDEESS
ncbi:MAG: hypothetical protein GKR89_11640 [Candidatus Latescibacteria bacterium]|nr:hypothetical protein [Candidatus Latescibacterota bacterium]